MPFFLEAYRTTTDNCNGVVVSKRLGTKHLELKKEIYVSDLLKFLKTSCCPDQRNRCLYCTEAYNYRNLPRGFKVHFDAATSEFWHSNSTPKQECASVYLDGGLVAKNKLYQCVKRILKEGTVIYFRPDMNRRNKLINMEFRVIVKEEAVNHLSLLQRAREKAKLSMDLQEEQRRIATAAVVDHTQNPIGALQVKQEPFAEDDHDIDACAHAPFAFAKEVSQELKRDDPPASPFLQQSSNKNNGSGSTGCDPPGSSPVFRSPKQLEHVAITASLLSYSSFPLNENATKNKQLKAD